MRRLIEKLTVLGRHRLFKYVSIERRRYLGAFGGLRRANMIESMSHGGDMSFG